jgi:hypothetical protein
VHLDYSLAGRDQELSTKTTVYLSDEFLAMLQKTIGLLEAYNKWERICTRVGMSVQGGREHSWLENPMPYTMNEVLARSNAMSLMRRLNEFNLIVRADGPGETAKDMIVVPPPKWVDLLIPDVVRQSESSE